MNAVGKIRTAFLRSGKSFLETILSDAARILRMDDMGN